MMKIKSKNILQSLINGEKSFCTLCFSSIDILESYLTISDKVILKTENEKSVVDILNFIFTPGISTDFLTTYICIPCAKSALSSYLFIKMVKENSDYLSETIKNVTNILKSNLEENLEFFKTLYLLNEDSKFLSCYDTKREINSIEIAKLRLDTILLEENIISIDIEFEQQENEQPQHRKEENTQLQYRKEENEQLQHREEIKHLKHSKEKNAHLQHRKVENAPLQHRKEENTHLQYRNEKNEQLQHRKEENEQQQNRKEKTIDSDLVNMCERDGKSVQCKLCLKVFPAQRYFNRHYYRIHAPKTIKCPNCPRLFGATNILNEHRNKCHKGLCIECGKAFKNSSTLRKHKLSHRISYPCEKCKHVYKRKETYDKHLKFQICDQKQKKYQSDMVFACDTCNKKFCHKRSLKIHTDFMHGNGKAYVCEWCSKKYSTQSHLNAHTVKHTQHKKLFCTVCNGKFSTQKSLTIHTRPYKCVDCDASFMCSTRISKHIHLYHKQLQHLQFKCDLCYSNFKHKSSLDRHKKRVKCGEGQGSIKQLLRNRKNLTHQSSYSKQHVGS